MFDSPQTRLRDKLQGGAPGVMSPEVVGSIPASRADGSEPPRRGSDVDDVVAVGSTPAGATPKLYVIGRADLAPGLRAAQIGHACITWVEHHGTPPDNLVLLEARDEEHLWDLLQQFYTLGWPHSSFQEPDLDDETTAVATAHPDARRLLSSLPLAFRR